MFDSPMRLLLGLVIGIVFGVLLQKGQVAKFSVIVSQFILKDWTVVKIMGTAVIVGSVGVYVLIATGFAELHIKPFLIGGVLLGGVCFGVGMAILGYCPGTGVVVLSASHVVKFRSQGNESKIVYVSCWRSSSKSVGTAEPSVAC